MKEHDSTSVPTTEHSCRSGMCSTSLMKSGCPSCLLIGLVMLPFEWLARGVRKLFAADAHRRVPR